MRPTLLSPRLAKCWLSLLVAFPLASLAEPTPSTLLNTHQLNVELPVASDPDLTRSPALPVPNELEKPLNDVRITVKAYDLIGVDRQHIQELASKLEQFVGESRTFEDLNNAARAVTQYMQTELGLYLAYAYIPAQEVNDGVVRIQALPGTLEGIEIQWPSDELRVDRALIERYLSRLKPGSVIRVSEIERTVYLLNDLRGVDVAFMVKPGRQTGQAVIVAQVKSTNPISGYVGIDNTGSRYAGAIRAQAQVNWESPLGLGDALSIYQLQSETRGLRFDLLGYTLPIGTDGLKLGLNFSEVHYRLNENDLPLGLSGESETQGLFFLYPFKRSRNLNVFGVLGLDYKEFEDRQAFASTETRKEVLTSKALINGDQRDAWLGGGIGVFSFGVEESRVRYDIARPSGLDDDEQTVKLTYSWGRLQNVLPGSVAFWANLRGQYALNNLDSSDQCSLGGASSVRAFAQGEASGDSCSVLTLEVRYIPDWALLGESNRQWSVNLFWDEGHVRFRQDPSARPASLANRDSLSGYGLGLVWEKPKSFTFSLSAAWEATGLRRADPKQESPRIFTSYQLYF